MRLGSKQFLLISAAAALTAILYFAPRKLDKKEEIRQTETFTLETISTEAKSSLKRQEADQVSSLEKEFEKEHSVALADSLGKTWDRYSKPFVSAFYYEEVAHMDPTEKNWINAAYRYYDSFKMLSDSSIRNFYVNKAIDSYKNVLEINPDNLDAKTDLGLCYAEGSGAPMQGITLLREVVEKNPNHEMAQFNLGVLSVRSQQYEKAVDRFKKVLEINPSREDAKYLLGRTYVMMGEKDLALQSLHELEKTTDPNLQQEVSTLINQINNN